MQTVYESPDQRDIPSSMCEKKRDCYFSCNFPKHSIKDDLEWKWYDR